MNYVDWKLDGFLDHNCGSKCYDGHQGTNFTLKSFQQMDSGVDVLAAASDGVVTFIQDGLFDKETDGDITKRLGNYIAIKHANLYYTYYGHLKKNSLKVASGDTVKSGDIIAQVRSSGNSTDPHLHFELWYDSSFVVDPFIGPCGNNQTLWKSNISYDSSFGHFDYGVRLDSNLGINDLRYRDKSFSKPLVTYPSTDSNIYFWSHLYGLRKGDLMTLNWFTPDGSEWFEFGFTIDQDYWYYYYWSFIDHQNLASGKRQMASETK